MVSGATVSITGGASEQELLVFVELAHPRTLHILSARANPTSLLVETSVVVSNGTVTTGGLHGGFELIPLAAMNRLGATTSRPVISRGGVNTVLDMSYLRSHLTRYVDSRQWGRASAR
ncbi:MAG: hypothetical protein LAP87_12820 [Acidobacteriia bacterium]|nr:hypothetical protein [Terriglobia bacterium]